MKSLIPLSLLLILACYSEDPLSKEEIIHTASSYNRQFYTNELDSLHPHFFEKSFTLRDLEEFRAKVDRELGTEISVYDEIYEDKLWKNKRYHGYVRYSKFTHAERPVRTIFGFDDEKTIYRFEVIAIPEAAYSRFEDYRPKTDLRLPFEGEWAVASGGRSGMYNHHVVASDQRFACDFFIRRNGKSYEGSGFNNSNYYCFNQKIYAPGDGIVVDVINHVAENRIGVMPPEISGNRVIIDHINGEYSVMAHFRQGSIVVKKGDIVKSGQYLGRCGNSGYSFEPHLHYHLQNSPVMFQGEGYPIRFKSYYCNGKYVEDGEPGYNEKLSILPE